ncbi:hypothetical protein NIES30_17605 [Phormidium tenue NIES-30]|uniref:LRAT domain-containing protein n=2 Tax=Phormidium tenue TaxID=126344 RepID=A0A1U7J285_9CYAN|nr:hypothetical protein NIES30_17605 [Phormidium tenue NIES-30]
MPIQSLAGLADHYFLSETGRFDNSLGWGPEGLELKGIVKVTELQLERVEQFMAAAQYSIAVNNCEHFANYVLYGINLSSQQHTWWKDLGAEVISRLQLTQGRGANYQTFMRQQVAELLNENLRQEHIKRANQERIDFWKARGVDVK